MSVENDPANDKTVTDSAETKTADSTTADDSKNGIKEESNSPSKPKNPKLKELFQSPDSATRKIIITSLVSGILAIILFVAFVTQVVLRKKNQPKEVEEVKEVLVKPVHKVDLGEFHIFLRPEKIEGPEGELRVDIFLEMESEASAEAMKKKIPEARDLIFQILINLGREDLMTPKNRDQIRKMMIDRLGTLKLPGKVTQVYITNILLEDP